ncbi:hypothetical protein ACFE04_016260 [Oxalis oulophora]
MAIFAPQLVYLLVPRRLCLSLHIEFVDQIARLGWMTSNLWNRKFSDQLLLFYIIVRKICLASVEGFQTTYCGNYEEMHRFRHHVRASIPLILEFVLGSENATYEKLGRHACAL